MTITTNQKEVSAQMRALMGALKKEAPKVANFAAEIIKDEINDGIVNRRKIDGTARGEKLDSATIKAKRKGNASSPDTPLFDTGVMKNVNIRKAKPNNPKAAVIAPKSRLSVKGFNVAAHHQEGKFGEWFGISPGAIRRMKKLSNDTFSKLTRRFNAS